jgi:hypothetical protein
LTPAPPLLPPAGDWICPSCSNLNFQWRDACKQCATPKPEQATLVGADGEVVDPGLQPGQVAKPGDWKCGSCGNVK